MVGLRLKLSAQPLTQAPFFGSPHAYSHSPQTRSATAPSTNSTISGVGVPGPNTAFTPMSSSAARSCLHPREYLWEQLHVGAGQDREPDHVHVLLQRRLRDHLGGLADARVHYLHTGVSQHARDDLRATVMAVEPGLRHQHPYDPTIAHVLSSRTKGDSSRSETHPLSSQ